VSSLELSCEYGLVTNPTQRKYVIRDRCADVSGGADHGKGERRLVAPMPGKVVRFLVGENSPVEAGQGVVVVEAMKMQNEIKSPKKGTVVKLSVAEGAAVYAGDVLAIVE